MFKYMRTKNKTKIFTFSAEQKMTEALRSK